MEDVTRPGRGRENREETETEKVTNKTGDDEGEEEAEGEEIYHDAIGEEGRTKESSGINENEDAQKKVEKNNDVRSLEFSRVMEPTVTGIKLENIRMKRTLQKVTQKED